MVMACPHCKVEHYEHKLTCRKCGKYMNTGAADQSAGGFPMNGVMVLLGLVVVATLVGAACVLVLRPKGPAADSATSAPMTGQAVQTASAQPGLKSSKRRGRHRHQ